MENEKKVVAIIPARMGSSRLPGKPMMEIRGMPLLWHTYMAAKACKSVWRVLVTSPDKSVNEWCESHGLTWYPSTPECRTGTHRCAEVASLMSRKLGGDFLVVNWQVDEPLVQPEWIESLVRMHHVTEDISTLVAPADPGLCEDRNMVKVAVSRNSECMWFSRAPMAGARLHCGIYCYSYATLFSLGRLPVTELSAAESLEQLAWIEEAYCVRAVAIPRLPLSVNSQEDLDKLRAVMEAPDHAL